MDTIDKQVVYDELERVRTTFHQWVRTMTAEDLDRSSNGTRWTNRELLFHLLFGYLIVRRLLWMIRLFGVLPAALSRPFAAMLNFATKPFDTVNYLGSRIGGRIFRPARMAASLDRVTAWLAARLARETDRTLTLGMHYPTRWDPFFLDYMTVADLYRYPTRHFDFHADQLSV
jgi:hypothetical protein